MNYLVFRFIVQARLVSAVLSLWKKKSDPDWDAKRNQPNNYFMLFKSIAQLESFDAEHFKYIALNGYTHEKNHAFYPGFPMVLHWLYQAGKAYLPTKVAHFCFHSIDDFYVNFMAFFYQLIIGMLTTVLIYKVGIRMLENQFFPMLKKSEIDKESYKYFKMKYRIE